MKNINEYLTQSHKHINEAKNGVIYESDGLKIVSTGNVHYYIEEGDDEGDMDIDKSMNLNDYGTIGYRVSWEVEFDELEFYYDDELYFTAEEVVFDRSITPFSEIWFGFSCEDSLSLNTDYANVHKIKNKLLNAVESIFSALTDDEDEAGIARGHCKNEVKELLDELKEIEDDRDDDW